MSGRKNPNPNYCITRMEYGRSQCWWLRMMRAGTVHSATFSDSKHGGKSQALKAAKAVRDRWEEQFPARTTRSGTPVKEVGSYRITREKRWVTRRDGWSYLVDVLSVRMKTGHGRGYTGSNYRLDNWTEAEARRRLEKWATDKRAALGVSGRRQ